MKPRSIKCPSCDGRGISALFGFEDCKVKCLWCQGKRKVGEETALRYAATIECLAFGSYIEGGTLEELRVDEAKAKAIREHFA